MGLEPLVRSGAPTAFIVVGAPADLGALEHALDDAHPDTTVVHLRGAKLRTAAGFFDELAAALQFPFWFGANWNALIDVARDRDWLAGHVLAVYDVHELLADAGERDRRECAEVLELLGRGGGDRGAEPLAEPDDHGFHLLGQLPAAEAERFLPVWRDAGLTIAILDPPG